MERKSDEATLSLNADDLFWSGVSLNTKDMPSIHIANQVHESMPLLSSQIPLTICLHAQKPLRSSLVLLIEEVGDSTIQLHFFG